MMGLVGALSIFTYRGTRADWTGEKIESSLGIGLIATSITMAAAFAILMIYFETKLVLT